MDDLARLAPALDALVASGANTLGNIEFDIREPQRLLAEARADAMHDAIERARTYAGAGGFALGPVLSVSESGVEMPRPLVVTAMRMAAAAPPPIAGGQNSISATISVTFGIR